MGLSCHTGSSEAFRAISGYLRSRSGCSGPGPLYLEAVLTSTLKYSVDGAPLRSKVRAKSLRQVSVPWALHVVGRRCGLGRVTADKGDPHLLLRSPLLEMCLLLNSNPSDLFPQTFLSGLLPRLPPPLSAKPSPSRILEVTGVRAAPDRLRTGVSKALYLRYLPASFPCSDHLCLLFSAQRKICNP